jgi:hypothetical protein
MAVAPMMADARLQERGRALGALLNARVSATRLIQLDAAVWSGCTSDWPQRPEWQLECRCDPLLYWPDVAGPREWERYEKRAR